MLYDIFFFSLNIDQSYEVHNDTEMFNAPPLI